MTAEVVIAPSRRFGIISALGIVEILAWGSSYYLSAIIAKEVAAEMTWPIAWAVGGMAVGSLISGLVAPKVGRLIAARGGRKTVAGGSLVLAAGLALLGISVDLVSFFAAWIIIGLGMSATLYNAAFSTLGRIFGDKARPAISTLTLFGGFASTVCWPLTTLLMESYGWRSACFAYAVIHLAISLPLILFGLPAEDHQPESAKASSGDVTSDAPPVHRLVFPILAVISIGCDVISSVISVHLITLMTERGYSLAFAVSMGMLLGPAQVGARIIEMTVGRKLHPIWTLIASVALTSTGMVLLLVDFPLPGVALVLYGAGNGIWSIARGTLPLALFGKDRYPVVMGKLARPGLIAQAAAPTITAMILSGAGVVPTLTMLVIIGLVNVSLAVGLRRVSR
ncbi:MFS transporter [Lacibacterium aquatile]|uniref:MFS transporter n=1 Tax=Lacibacterium aquatile TaxID=1168082 RepID=A0ABW5DVK6_9PROT